MVSLSRRSVLRGAAALGVVGAAGGLGLAACGGDEEGGVEGNVEGNGDVSSKLVLLSMVPPGTIAAGTDARLVFAVGDARGAPIMEAPDRLTFSVRNAQTGAEVASGLEVPSHDAGLPTAYFPMVVTIDEAGFYEAVSEADGSDLSAAFQVSAPDEIDIPRAPQPFPSVTTPTTADPAGVDPICTREPPCPLHAVELTTALGKEPVALLVSTPAFCQTAICGPVLDLFVDAEAEFPDVTFIHVEVYASAEEVEAEGLQAPLAPAVEALGLPFEPALFLIAADGTIAERIDVVYDQVELRDSLATIAP